jgi:PKHD-type hydroxylase
MQFTSYANDQYYHWHSDGLSDRSGLDKNNKIRKLSAVLFLNNTFSGGELEMSVLDSGAKKRIFKPSPKATKGSIIVFPSFITHRITPVKQGVRYSIVLWCSGPQFK